jgi:hypothetical protein
MYNQTATFEPSSEPLLPAKVSKSAEFQLEIPVSISHI